jgi:hypothetical protein
MDEETLYRLAKRVMDKPDAYPAWVVQLATDARDSIESVRDTRTVVEMKRSLRQFSEANDFGPGRQHWRT